MENNRLVAKPLELIFWQLKIDLMVASNPQHAECYILAEDKV